MPNNLPRDGIELNEHGIPPFEALPLRQDDPYLSAWGLYGNNDELGALNRLSGDLVVKAKAEIRNGTRFVPLPGSRLWSLIFERCLVNM